MELLRAGLVGVREDGGLGFDGLLDFAREIENAIDDQVTVAITLYEKDWLRREEERRIQNQIKANETTERLKKSMNFPGLIKSKQDKPASEHDQSQADDDSDLDTPEAKEEAQ